MSTELRNVGTDMTQTRFWGGKERGTCVQITQRARAEDLPLKIGYIQLTREEAGKLSYELARFAAKEEVGMI